MPLDFATRARPTDAARAARVERASGERMTIFRNPWVDYWIRDPLWGALYHAVYHAIGWLPCGAASNLGAQLGLAEGGLRSAALQPRMERCLSVIRSELPPSHRASIVREMWRNVGRVHAEMAVLDRLWEAATVTLVNARALRNAHLDGRPIVFVFSHLGNWEMLAVAVQREGVALNVVYEELHNRFEKRLAERSRRKLGYRLIPPTRRGAREIYAALRRHEAVALAMDEFKDGDVIAPAFGRPLPEACNIAYAVRLARRFNAIIVPAYCVRTGPLAFTLTFLDKLTNPDTALLNALCESWIRAHPEQWYMLWRLVPDGLAKIEGNSP
jgi:KDO2-lipid IV(A) lauroyltransferase